MKELPLKNHDFVLKNGRLFCNFEVHREERWLGGKRDLYAGRQRDLCAGDLYAGGLYAGGNESTGKYVSS